MEKASLLCNQGRRVGLFSYNKGLSQYLQDRVSTWRHVTIHIDENLRNTRKIADTFKSFAQGVGKRDPLKDGR